MIQVLFWGTCPRGIVKRHLEYAVQETFRACRRRMNGTLSIGCVSRTRMAALNSTWRGMRRPTDVLSFTPQSVPAFRSSGVEKDWGDLILSPEVIRREALRRGVEMREEMLRMVVHGVLHLFGFDHANARDELAMFTLQERIVARTRSRL